MPDIERARALASTGAASNIALENVARELFVVLLISNSAPARSVVAESLHELLQRWDSVYSAFLPTWLQELASSRYGFWRLHALMDIPSMQAAVLPLLNDPDKYVRREAIWALEPLTSQDLVRDLLLHSLLDQSWYIRRAALAALRSRANVPVVRSAIEQLVFDHDCNVLKDVVQVLGTDANAAQKAFRQRLNDPDSCVRQLAASVVTTSFIDQIDWTALPAMADNDDPAVRRVALAALARHPVDAQARSTLLSLTRDPERHIRTSAIRSLSSASNYPEVKQALIDGSLRLDDDSSYFVEALAYVAGEPDVYTHLLAMLQSVPTSPRERSLKSTLAESLSTGVLQVPVVDGSLLLPVLRHDDFSVRSAAVRAMSKRVEVEPVRELLLQMLNDEQSYVSIDAAKALAPLSNDQHIKLAIWKTILRLLNSDRARERYGAAFALGWKVRFLLAEESIRDRLAALLEDEDAKVREAASSALSRPL